MTYVMSDIHGNFEKYESMLKLINLSDGDDLYVIGDAIDRGKDGIRVLRDIMQRPNVHMLLGNHEWMAIETILAGDERSKDEMLKLWIRNGGTITYFDLMTLDTEELDKIVSFLVSLPVSVEIQVNGRKFYLIHGFPADNRKAQVWKRPDLDTLNPFTDCTLIIGHTPVALLYGTADENAADYVGNRYNFGEYFKIEHAKGFIDIDCGCGSKIPQSRLACLRLDDMEEFYV